MEFEILAKSLRATGEYINTNYFIIRWNFSTVALLKKRINIQLFVFYNKWLIPVSFKIFRLEF